MSKNGGVAQCRLQECLSEYRPPKNILAVCEDINLSVSRSIHQRGERLELKRIRRGAAALLRTLEDSAMLVTSVHPDAWDSARCHELTQPPGDTGLRCLWLLAFAWRVVCLVDYKRLSKAEMRTLGTMVTDAKSAAMSLPSGFRIDAEELLRDSEADLDKAPGAELKPASGKRTCLRA